MLKEWTLENQLKNCYFKDLGMHLNLFRLSQNLQDELKYKIINKKFNGFYCLILGYF